MCVHVDFLIKWGGTGTEYTRVQQKCCGVGLFLGATPARIWLQFYSVFNVLSAELKQYRYLLVFSITIIHESVKKKFKSPKCYVSFFVNWQLWLILLAKDWSRPTAGRPWQKYLWRGSGSEKRPDPKTGFFHA